MTVLPRVPLADPRADLAPIRDEILSAIAGVIDTGTYVLGAQVAALEQKLASRFGTAGAVGVGCGTDALALALLAIGVAPGDEVITVSHTAGATVAAICMIGAVPVLVDVDPLTYCLDAGMLEAALSSRTRAIIPVHLYGHPSDLDRIGDFARRHGIGVVEDCAQAQEATIGGRPVGSIGDAAGFSFYPTKILGAIGDGGLVTASRPEIVDRVRRLRTYGWSKPQYSEIAAGRCSRLDELQAAILAVKIARLGESIEKRRALARRYSAALADLPLALPIERPECRHVYHLYVVRSDRREALARHLDHAGVSIGFHYPIPIHAQPGLAAKCRVAGTLSTTDMLAREILSLPLYPSLPPYMQERVINAVRTFFGRH